MIWFGEAVWLCCFSFMFIIDNDIKEIVTHTITDKKIESQYKVKMGERICH